MTVSGEPALDNRHFDDVAVTFAPGGKASRRENSFIYQSAADNSTTPAITASGITISGIDAIGFGRAPPLPPGQMELISSIIFKVKGLDSTFDFHTGALKPVLTAMDTCLASLVNSWELDPVQQAQASIPVPDNYPGSWVTSNDYPLNAISDRIQGIVHFRVILNSNGQPTNCEVQDEQPLPVLAGWTCTLILTRAHFRPRKIEHGEPKLTYVVSAVRWILPH